MGAGCARARDRSQIARIRNKKDRAGWGMRVSSNGWMNRYLVSRRKLRGAKAMKHTAHAIAAARAPERTKRHAFQKRITQINVGAIARSEERRVGKECRS